MEAEASDPPESPSDTITETPRSSLLSAGYLAVAVATAPFVGYMLAFLYEAGGASFFGIPWNMISLNIVTVLTWIVASGIIIVGQVYSIAIQRHPVLISIAFALTAAVTWLAKGSLLGLPTTVIAVVWIVLAHGSFLLRHLARRSPSENSVLAVSALGAQELARRPLWAGVVTLIVASLLSYSFGLINERDAREHFVVRGSSNTFLMKAYSDLLFLGTFEPAKVGDRQLVLELRNTGALSPR